MPQAIGPRFEAHKIPNPNLESHLLYPEITPHGYSADRRWITCFDPATGFHLETVRADSADEITHKIARAADAQKDWKKTSFRDRRRVMLSLKKWLVDNQETCARVACRDTGKTCERRWHIFLLNTVMTTVSSAGCWVGGGSDNLFETGLAYPTWRTIPPPRVEAN